jgi:basic amino acid/polyamine antiporter, APA family
MTEKVSGKQPRENKPGKLKKELGLFDVYCIATGAMVSSGLFLLPGIATATGGPATVLAYMAAGILMIPSMLSMLELSTALPRAGGSYYFLDRSLGPAMGTVTGIGAWLALVLKSAFALVGMGAYLTIMPGIAQYLSPGDAGTVWLVKILAIGLTVLFVALNIFGARESTSLMRLLVIAMLAILGLFIVQGIWFIATQMPEGRLTEQYTPLLHPRHGLTGWISTIGIVFISYSGLPQIASISEEVRQPERSLPLGVILALATATGVYVISIFIMIAVLDPEVLRGDLAPMAAASHAIFTWIPAAAGAAMISIAAIAAFISTGNAGILSASRYPLAMARDRLMPRRFETLGRFHTPGPAIVLTGAAMVLLILVLSAEGVARLGSTINLLVFALINLAVIVMRESRIEGYDPGFRAPLYPWLPLAGILISGWLIIEMGWPSSLASAGVVGFGIVWYFRYARLKVNRSGAVHHVFERLGRSRYPGLQTEFREIIKEKGLRKDDPFDDIVARAYVIDVTNGTEFEEIVNRASELLARRIPLKPENIATRLIDTGRYGGAPISQGMALLHFRSAAVKHSEMAIARSRGGVCVFLPPDDPSQPQVNSCDVFGIIILVSPEKNAAQHLRILAELAAQAENPSFIDALRRNENPRNLKGIIMRDSRFLDH